MKSGAYKFDGLLSEKGELFTCEHQVFSAFGQKTFHHKILLILLFLM